MAPEVVLRRGAAARPHGGEPLAVAQHDRIVDVEPADQPARKLGGAAAFADPEEGPGAFAETVHQAGLGKEPQMPRQPRLRLAENFGEIGHRQFGLGEQRQDPQPRRLAGGFQGGGHAGKA